MLTSYSYILLSVCSAAISVLVMYMGFLEDALISGSLLALLCLACAFFFTKKAERRYLKEVEDGRLFKGDFVG